MSARQLKLRLLDKPDRVDLAYIAGLVDGEGSIGAPASYHNRDNFRIYVSLTMCDREPLDFTAAVLGGRVYQLARRTRHDRAIFEWRLWCQHAAEALESILPFMVLKRQRAVDAIELAGRIYRGKYGHGRGSAVPVNEGIARRAIADRITDANFGSNGRLRHAAKARTERKNDTI
jgi:hypothetical protein